MSTTEANQSAASNSKAPSLKKERKPKASKPQDNKQKPQYSRLYTEVNSEEKSVLIKITKNHSTRQIIQYVLDKIKDDWKVTFNAFGIEMGKALNSVEIAKSRYPFLHQENKLISLDVSRDVTSKDEEGKEVTTKKEFKRSGLSVTISRLKFEVTDDVGY